MRKRLVLLALGVPAVLLVLFAGTWLAPRRHRRLAAAVVSHFHAPKGYLVPVAGVTEKSLRSTFGAPRPGGRHHEGADIFARRDTPVVAATAGTVLKVGLDPLGGRVVTVLGDGPAFYYYAHLDHWARDLSPGDEVRPGEVLGFVGNTGDARTTPCHLHFGIYRFSWRGVHAVDPVPILQKHHARMVSIRSARRRYLRVHGLAEGPRQGAVAPAGGVATG